MLLAIGRQDYPGVHPGVVTREGLASQAVVVIFVCILVTVNLRGIPTTFYIDQERGVFHYIVCKSFSSLRISLVSIVI